MSDSDEQLDPAFLKILDQLYELAVRIVRREKTITNKHLHRRMMELLGSKEIVRFYGCKLFLIMMESGGVVGPVNSKGVRKVLAGAARPEALLPPPPPDS